MDMSKLAKKEFPAQQRERLQWVLDTVRENQNDVWRIIQGLTNKFYPDDHNLTGIHKQKRAIKIFRSMRKHDRDALLVPGGVLTDEQRELLAD